MRVNHSLGCCHLARPTGSLVLTHPVLLAHVLGEFASDRDGRQRSQTGLQACSSRAAQRSSGFSSSPMQSGGLDRMGPSSHDHRTHPASASIA